MTQIASLPLLRVEVAFNPTDLLNLTQTWTEITPYVRDFGTHGGRQHYLDRIEASTLSMTLDNRTGFFMNGNYSSVTAVSGSGSVVTYTCANSFTAGSNVTITGVTGGTGGQPYSGTYVVLAATSTQFTVTNAQTGAATLSSATAVTRPIIGTRLPIRVLSGWPQKSITAISGSGSTVTYTVSNTYLAGQQVLVAGSNIDGYNGYFTVATASSTQFTVTSTVTGTADLANYPTLVGNAYTIFWGVIDTIDTSLQDALNSDLYLSASDSLKYLSLRYLYNTTLFATYANIASVRSWYNTANGNTYVDNIGQSAPITAVSGSGTAVTYTCANSFTAGNSVIIQGVTGGSGGDPYSGTYTIASASSTQFTVTNTQTGAATLSSARATQVGYNGSIVGLHTDAEGVLLYEKTKSVDLTNGSTDNTAYIQIPVLNSGATPADDCIEFWIIGQAVADVTLLPLYLTGGFFGLDTTLRVNSAGQVYIASQTSPPASLAFSGLQSNVVINDGLWHHVAVLVDNSTSRITLIVDGVASTYTGFTLSGVGFTTTGIDSQYHIADGVPCYIDQVVISGVYVTSTEVKNRYAAGSLLRNDANAADRIAQALVIGGRGSISSGAVSVPNYLVNGSTYTPGATSNGTIYCQGTLAPVTTSSVLDSIFEAVDTEIGVFYQGDDGVLNFHTRGYLYRSAGNATPSGAYVWTDDTTSTYHYEAPSFQLTRDDVDTWTTVIVSPTNGTAQIYENVANETRWGQSTLTKSSTATTLEAAYQTAVYLGNVFATPLARVNTLKLKSETDNGSNLDAMLGVNLQDRITVKRTPINASAAGITNTDMSVESTNHEFAAEPGFWHTTFTLDPYPIRFSTQSSPTYFLIADDATYGKSDLDVAL